MKVLRSCRAWPGSPPSRPMLVAIADPAPARARLLGVQRAQARGGRGARAPRARPLRAATTPRRSGTPPSRLPLLHRPAGQPVRDLRGRARHRRHPGAAAPSTPRSSPWAPLLASPRRDHRRLHAPHPPSARHEPGAPPRRAHGRVLHLRRVQHRRLPDAAGRSAPVPRLPARRPLLLDAAPRSALAAGQRHAARRLLLLGPSRLRPRGRRPALAFDETARTARSA